MNVKKYLLYPVNIPILFLSILVVCAGIGVILGFKRCKRHFVFHELLHPVRDAYQRIPSYKYLFAQTPKDVSHEVDQLNKHGIVHIKNFFAPDQLARIQAEFEQFIQVIQKQPDTIDDNGAGFTEDFFSKKEQAYYTTNPFKYSRELVDSCCNTKLTGIVNHYLQSNGYIYRAGGARILPKPDTGFGSFQWHHDAWGKSLNVMFVLSDIGDGDQAMTYVMGSHKLRHSFEKFMRSRLTLDYCKERMDKTEIFTCKAKAGDIFIFDTNGVHSGNRTPGKARDTFIVSYSTDKTHIWNFSLPGEYVKQYASQENNPFARVIEQQKNNQNGPLFPEISSWVDGVIQVNRWI